jgi:hypothetical protein
MAYLGYLLLRNWDTVTVCDQKKRGVQEESDDEPEKDDDGVFVYDERGCREAEFKPVWRFVIVLVVGTIIASIVAAGVYRTALYVKNPRLGIGIEATRYLTDVLKT